jgi:hypothetical protein
MLPKEAVHPRIRPVDLHHRARSPAARIKRSTRRRLTPPVVTQPWRQAGDCIARSMSGKEDPQSLHQLPVLGRLRFRAGVARQSSPLATLQSGQSRLTGTVPR